MALVGTNLQGKSYKISSEIKGTIAKKTILVTNEVKADENLKNSSDTSTLITWLNSLLDNSKVKSAIQEEIDKVDLSSINKNSFLNISLNNNLDSYKGIISAEIKTDSNQWNKPGLGEKFLGQLLLISKILEDNRDDNFECLVIDEPEQHLHPSLYIKVAKILNKISYQGIKVIIDTHSPIITQYFVEDTSEIAHVNGECNYLQPINELISLSKDFDCYKKEELKLKDYRAIERKIFDLYLLEYGANMGRNNIEYALVYGKIFFPIVLSTLKRLNIKTLTLYDLDAENQQQHKYLNDTIASLPNEYISFKPKIETYFNIADMNIDKYRGLTILMNEYYLIYI